MAFDYKMLGSHSDICAGCGAPLDDPIYALTEDEVYCQACSRHFKADRSQDNFDRLEFDIHNIERTDFDIHAPGVS